MSALNITLLVIGGALTLIGFVGMMSRDPYHTPDSKDITR